MPVSYPFLVPRSRSFVVLGSFTRPRKFIAPRGTDKNVCLDRWKNAAKKLLSTLHRCLEWKKEKVCATEYGGKSVGPWGACFIGLYPLNILGWAGTNPYSLHILYLWPSASPLGGNDRFICPGKIVYGKAFEASEIEAECNALNKFSGFSNVQLTFAVSNC